MRTDDLSGGSLKALLILLLVAANIIAALPNERAWLHFPGSARAPSVSTTASGAKDQGKFPGRTRETALDATALAGQSPH